jgi:beta-lactamase superfamily II metal-dependent hydrolase
VARVARQQIVIDFWDVGQGDATVIRPSPTHAFIIDVGPRNSPIVDWIAQNPSIFIEGIVLTHNDADHAGALAALIDAARFRIECVYFLLDRNAKDSRFVRLFSRLNAAIRAGEVKRVLRLEAYGEIRQPQ